MILLDKLPVTIFKTEEKAAELAALNAAGDPDSSYTVEAWLPKGYVIVVSDFDGFRLGVL